MQIKKITLTGFDFSGPIVLSPVTTRFTKHIAGLLMFRLSDIDFETEDQAQDAADFHFTRLSCLTGPENFPSKLLVELEFKS